MQTSSNMSTRVTDIGLPTAVKKKKKKEKCMQVAHRCIDSKNVCPDSSDGD